MRALTRQQVCDSPFLDCRGGVVHWPGGNQAKGFQIQANSMVVSVLANVGLGGGAIASSSHREGRWNNPIATSKFDFMM